MNLFNVIIYWNYGSKTTYHNVKSLEKFIIYFTQTNQLSAFEKFFVYRIQKVGQSKGDYCGYWFPKTGLRLFR